jgi:hypothetical protein
VTGWEIACIIGAAVWVAQTFALAFWFLPRMGHRCIQAGYRLRLREEQAGIPARKDPPDA